MLPSYQLDLVEPDPCNICHANFLINLGRRAMEQKARKIQPKPVKQLPGRRGQRQVNRTCLSLAVPAGSFLWIHVIPVMQFSVKMPQKSKIAPISCIALEDVFRASPGLGSAWRGPFSCLPVTRAGLLASWEGWGKWVGGWRKWGMTNAPRWLSSHQLLNMQEQQWTKEPQSWLFEKIMSSPGLNSLLSISCKLFIIPELRPPR